MTVIKNMATKKRTGCVNILNQNNIARKESCTPQDPSPYNINSTRVSAILGSITGITDFKRLTKMAAISTLTNFSHRYENIRETSVKRKTQQINVVLFLLVCFLSHGLAAPLPVFQQDGELMIVCLFDIHENMQNGGCVDFKKETMEMAYTSLWKLEQLNLSLSIGLTVYDTCGSDTKAIEIIYQHVIDGLQTNTTKFGGVISYLNGKTSSIISTMLHHLHLPHIQLTHTLTTKEEAAFDNTFNIPFLSEARIQAVIGALDVLNWTYISVMTLNSTTAIAEHDIFSKRLKTRPICVNEQRIIAFGDSGSLHIPDVKSKGVLLFTGDQLSNNLIPNIIKSQRNTVLIAGEFSKFNMANNSDTKDIMVLLERSPALEGLSQFISDQQTSFNVTYLSPELHLEGYKCNATTLCKLPPLNSRKLHATVESVKIMSAILKKPKLKECSVGNDDCSSSSLMELFKYYQSTGGEEINSYSELMTITALKQQQVNVGVTNISNFSGSVKVKGQLPISVLNSRCVDNCLSCTVCTATYTSSERIIKQDAGIYIVGSFPIFKSVNSKKCKEPNPAGLFAAKVFLSAIDSFKTRYSDTIALQNISIGGVVFDSCPYSKSPESRIQHIESCLYDYRDASGAIQNLPAERTTAYFNMHEDMNHITSSWRRPKLTSSVSPLGFGLEEHLNDNFIKSLAKVLYKLQWTYFKIIVSTNSALKHMINVFMDTIQAQDLCVAEIIEIGPSVDDYLPKETLMNTDGIGTLLFTTLEDSAKILDSIQSLNSSSTTQQKLFVFPWNVHALVDIKEPRFLKNALLFRPKTWPVTKGVEDIVKDKDVPWISEFQKFTRYNLSQEIESSVVVGVDLLLSTINAVYRDLCPDQVGICARFSDFQSLKPRLEDTFGMLLAGLESPFEIYDIRMVNGKLNSVQIGEVQENGNVTLELSRFGNTGRSYLDIPSSTCGIWCPKCYQCDSAKLSGTNDMLYLPGEIVVTGILPIHTQGTSSFLCGKLSGEIFADQLTEAFMYAIETAQTRYPYLLDQVKLGGMIIDGCSNPHKSTQMIGNFESCEYQFKDSNRLAPTPKSNLAYIVHGKNSSMDSVLNSVKDLGKLAVSTYGSVANPAQVSSDSSIIHKTAVIADLLVKLNWTYIYVVTSEEDDYRDSLNEFLKVASKRGICIGKILALGASVKSIVEVAEYLDSGSTAVVMMTKRFDIKLFFNNQVLNAPARPWIIDISSDDWNTDDLSDVKVPLGSLLIDKNGKNNEGFEKFMSQFDISSSRVTDWWRKYWQKKYNCYPPCKFNVTPNEYRPYSPKATKVIRAVDIALHAIHSQYLSSCPLTSGICANFVKSGMSLIPSRVFDVYFQDGDERVEFVDEQLSQKYLIKTYSSNQLYEVGVWKDGLLKLQSSFFQYVSSSTCTKGCHCENEPRFTNITGTRTDKQQSPDLTYWKETGVFNGKMWATVLVSIAATGAFISLILIVYVAHKVLRKTLAKRYVGLGILLLIGVMLLFLSVVPFIFTPSETLCGLRFFMPGCSYAFCFAIILVKLTSLRDYRLIGLGGEVSNLNQYLFVAFITAVQIAMAVQWWVMQTPLLVTKITDMTNVMYACKLHQADFVLHHIYVMILLVICAIYSITVRRETKNMGEARLLMWCTWLCIPVWIAWILVYLIQSPEFSEPTVCVAIVSCATLMMTVIFIPKIHMVAKIKYSIAKGATSFHNGYKLDSEFFYERPYSLPGTLTTNYSTMKTHPRSISNFDATLSY